MDRDNVTAMETDKIVDGDIGSPQVNTQTYNSGLNIGITLSFVVQFPLLLDETHPTISSTKSYQ